jgi:hypothetical protein
MGSKHVSKIGTSGSVAALQLAESGEKCSRFVAMVCADMSEADLVGLQLLKLKNGHLAAYRRMVDLAMNPPVGNVAITILSINDGPAAIRRSLGWLRHRWPRCSLVVVGKSGAGLHELTARQSGACYFTRPIEPGLLAAMLRNVLVRDVRDQAWPDDVLA